MTDRQSDIVHFLQWALPQLSLRWRGFRKVRGQVGKRLRRRLQELYLSDLEAYRRYLDDHPREWRVLDAACRITISRFYRDGHTFDHLREHVLPDIVTELVDRQPHLPDGPARPGVGIPGLPPGVPGPPDLTDHPTSPVRDPAAPPTPFMPTPVKRRVDLRIWSAGCASGEEPYTLALMTHHDLAPRFPELDLFTTILGTDADPMLLERAHQATYPRSSVRELPPEWLDAAFDHDLSRDIFALAPHHRRAVTLQEVDIRQAQPEGTFHLILCRNLAFCYFEESLQRVVLHGLLSRLEPGGALVIGGHDSLPETVPALVPEKGVNGIFRYRPVLYPSRASD